MEITNNRLVACLQFSTLIVFGLCQLDVPQDTVKFMVECESPSDKNSSSKLVKIEVLNSDKNFTQPTEELKDSLTDSSNNYFKVLPNPNLASTGLSNVPVIGNEASSGVINQVIPQPGGLLQNSGILTPIGNSPFLLGVPNVQGIGNNIQGLQAPGLGFSPILSNPGEVNNQGAQFANDIPIARQGNAESLVSTILHGVNPANFLPPILLPPIPIGNMVEGMTSLMNRNPGINGDFPNVNDGLQPNARGSLLDFLQNPILGDGSQIQRDSTSPLINPNIFERLSSGLNGNSNSNNPVNSIFGDNGIQSNIRNSLLDILRNPSVRDESQNPLNSQPSITNFNILERLSSILNRNSDSNNITPNLRESLLNILRNPTLRDGSPNQPFVQDSNIFNMLSSILNRNSNTNNISPDRIEPSARESLLETLRTLFDTSQNQLDSQPSSSNIIERLSSRLDKNLNSVGINANTNGDTIQPNFRESLLEILRNPTLKNSFQNQQDSSSSITPNLFERLSTLLNRNFDINSKPIARENEIQTNVRDLLMNFLKNTNDNNLSQNQPESRLSLNNQSLIERILGALNKNSNLNDQDVSENIKVNQTLRESLLSSLRDSKLGSLLQNRLESTTTLTNSSAIERLSSILNRNSDESNLDGRVDNNKIPSNIRESLLTLIKNSTLGDSLKNRLDLNLLLKNSDLDEKMSLGANRNSASNNKNSVESSSIQPLNLRESLLAALRNSTLRNKLQNQLKSSPLDDFSLIERLSSILNRSSNSNDLSTNVDAKRMQTNIREILLDILKKPSESLLQNQPKTQSSDTATDERFPSISNRNSDSEIINASNNDQEAQPNAIESILATLKNSNLANLLQNRIKSNSLNTNTDAFDKNFNVNNIENPIKDNIMQSNIKESIEQFLKNPKLRNELSDKQPADIDSKNLNLEKLSEETLLTKLSKLFNRNFNSNDGETSSSNNQLLEKSLNNEPSLSSILKKLTPENLVSSRLRTPSIAKSSDERISSSSKNSNLKDSDTSPTILNSVIKPPSYSNSLSLSPTNEKPNTIGDQSVPINGAPRTSYSRSSVINPFAKNLITPSRNVEALNNENIQQLYPELKPFARIPAPFNRNYVQNNMPESQTQPKFSIPPMLLNKPSENQKPLKFQSPKIQQSQQIRENDFNQPKFKLNQATKMRKPNANIKKPFEISKTTVPLEKLRNSLPTNQQLLDNIGMPSQLLTIPELPSLPSMVNLDDIRPSLNQIGPDGDLSKNTNKFINDLSSSMKGVVNVMKTASSGLRKALNLPSPPNSGSARQATSARFEPLGDMDTSFSEPQPAGIIRPIGINDNEFSESRPQSEQTCDVCNCLMKYVPKDVVDGKFVMNSPNPPLIPRINFPLNHKRLSTFTNKKIIDNDEDLVAMPDETRFVYALPPEDFKFNEEMGAENSQWDTSFVDDGIDKLTEFLHVVDRVDQFVSEKTKLIIKRLAQLSENNTSNEYKSI